MAGASSDGVVAESVRWEALDDDRRLATPRTWAFVGTVVALLVAFLYDYVVLPERQATFAWWDVSLLDWLFLLALVVFAFYVVVPLARNPRMTRYYWRQLRTDRLATASFVYVCLFFLAGLFGPVLAAPVEEYMLARDGAYGGMSSVQPPVGFTTSVFATSNCVGAVTNDVCHGTWLHPLGTTGAGRDVALLILRGSRVALQIALITSMLVVPLATIVGTVAAYFGGRVDETLMRYVDVQQAIPPFFVYLVARTMYHVELALMILIFGLLNWGGVARLVRSEALQKRDAQFVQAARNAGCSRLAIVRRHIVPNVSSTVLTAVTLQVPTLIIVETTLSFLKLGPLTAYRSWGYVIQTAMFSEYFPTWLWWQSGATVLVLVLTTVSFNVLGDALRDVLDPRVEGVND
ncbi:ABC transporter permease [Halomicrococcus sp. SG-WS-1]|uniref:ABC transporter permease n=1 Tax=Halomicrococcus sp. SG-WS-1 TaxID=3439057 RepID=UPI003F78FF60